METYHLYKKIYTPHILKEELMNQYINENSCRSNTQEVLRTTP